ncbi:methyltransferase domain-containing protein [Methylocystis sp. MJC1]|uniref:class I SAM-dependent methyltransferase n=1 Tax=Methylocystis sp. MJC1 TaxID=2654282 RepID=UPI0013EC3032|nr:rRNA adenine N-6-methyltransferase family protein [Methylocystis sp. MJC1]KAF2991281.1 Ribosomal RNA small subunit methyltransferase A [Methylocystis sp. MJC1]MBU6526180.1 methyltransferase domain-containing protein [Methylocystis sp. MJC1]UZX12634.1 methyltransferase domain-containing protein [Methylocystis sp. MJC1]
MQNAKASLADSARFIKQWIENPRLIGAVQPSGPALAKTMASFVDLSREGPIVELGPGTGPVTKALLARGIPAERLVLVEYESRFCHMLAERYPGVKIVQGDAYGLKKTLTDKIDGQVATVVSSLPLLVRPERDRVELLHQAFELMGDDGLFIQFTYGLAISPMPIHAHGLKGAYIGKGSAPVLLNIPPARVWRYRKAGHAGKP